MPELAETLASYVPSFIARRVSLDPMPVGEPRAERFSSAVLFADISGFTQLTTLMVQRGPAGVEELSRVLNAYFDQLIECITAHNGDIVKFAGDALLAIWSATDDDLTDVTRRAAQCGIEIATKLNGYETAYEVRLFLKLYIGAGETFAATIGGVNGRWGFLVAGTPLVQLSAAEKHGQSGSVVLSPEAWTIVAEHCEGQLLPNGHARLTTILDELPLHPLPSFAFTHEAEAALRPFITNAVLSRLDAGQTAWLAEFRRVTVLFISIRGLDYSTPHVLEQVQGVIHAMQTTLHHYEGTANEMRVDDKGTILIAAFGLPPFTHEDDAWRGLRAALDIQTKLNRLGLHSAIGVTTGRVFCGPIGNTRRREYTVHGDEVNLAARLMQVAPDNQVLCDEVTYQAARGQLLFDRLPSFVLKGKDSPIAVYRPRDQTTTGTTVHMVGRHAGRSEFTHRLQALQGGKGGTLLIEGEPGVGKSRLVEALLQDAQGYGVTTLVGKGDTIEKSTPYYAWRAIFSKILNLGAFLTAPEAQRIHILTQWQTEPNLLRLAPLLNVVLSLDLPDNEITSQMTGQVRADNTYDLLVSLLQRAATTSPLLLIVEDAQWLDSTSWALTLRVSRDVQSMLLVITTRPLVDPLPTEYIQLANASGTQRWLLNTLPPNESRALVCQRLGIQTVSEQLTDLIQRHTEGNPFFIEELAYALRDSGLIVVADGICQLAPGAKDLSTLNLPDTVQGMITSRIDQLTPSQQLTLKVASVIGRAFAFRILHDIHPIEVNKPHLKNYLNILERLELTPLYAPEPELTYIFKHVITQEVAYNLMLFEQRQQLHRATAEWYERTYAEGMSPFYPLLAHHWSRVVEFGGTESPVVERAIDYMEKVGEQALDTGAYKEAVSFLSEVLTLNTRIATDAPSPRDRLRRAHWERELAEAHLGMGNHREGRQHLQRALALLGWPVPILRGRLLLSTVGQVLGQLSHRLLPTKFVQRSSDEPVRFLEGARAYQRLMETYWFANETLPLIHAGIQTLNLAERAGPSPELARAYAVMSISAGGIPLHPLAEMYRRRALETAHSVNQLQALAYALFYPSVYAIGAAKWAQVEADLEQAAELFERVGDRRILGDALTVLGMSALYQGKFEHAIRQFTDVYTAGLRNDNIQHQVWGLIGKAEGVFRLGQIGESASLLESVLALFAENPDRAEELRSQGLLAAVRLRQGKMLLAQQAAERAASLIAQLWAPTSHYLLEGYASVAEVYLALWEANRDLPAAAREAPVKSAHQACKSLRKFSRVFPIGQPRAWLWQGVYEWLVGRPRKARRAWQRSLAAAERLGMPYEKGLAYYEVGRRLTVGEPSRHEHLTQACEIFTQLGARQDLARVKEQLTQKGMLLY
jgi:predicted ATPase/class 3 adenylate cyclase